MARKSLLKKLKSIFGRKTRKKKIIKRKVKVKRHARIVRIPFLESVFLVERGRKVRKKVKREIKPEIKPKREPIKFPKFQLPKFKLPTFKLKPKVARETVKPKKEIKPEKPKAPKLPAFHLPRLQLPKLKKEELRGILYRKVAEKPVIKKVPPEVEKEIIVADVMSKGVITVKPNDSLIYVVRLFADKKISGAPVVSGYNFVGIISESDIVKFVGLKDLLNVSSSGLKKLQEIKVEEVMHKNPISVYEYTKLSDAVDLMNKFDVTRLPVMNERRDLVGILTRSDLIRGISKELLLKILTRKPEEIERIRMKIDTDIDEILRVVERKGSISVDEIKQKIMLPEDKIEEWGKILEKHNLIEMFYPPIGKPEFRKKLK